jgi:chromosomal replication initiator protein DnaA
MDNIRLPAYLLACIDRGLINRGIAQEIERQRQQSFSSASDINLYSALSEEKQTLALSGYFPKLLMTRPDPEMTFDSFISFKGNEFTVEVARMIASEGGRRSVYNPLYVYGEVGLGKTHLLSAIASNPKSLKTALFNTADLMVEYNRACKQGVQAEFRTWLISCDILLVDDIQLCEDHAELQHELFAVFNHLMNSKKAMVISSDVAPTRLKGIEKRLLSRLSSGVIVALQMCDRNERIKVLDSLMSQKLPGAVVEFLADRLCDNMRRLKGAAKQLQIIQRNLKQELTIDLVRAVIPLPDDPNQAPTLRTTSEETQPKAKQEQIERYKNMFTAAESEAEQALALQIVIGQRIRQLREQNSDTNRLDALQRALGLLRDGKLREAMESVADDL